MTKRFQVFLAIVLVLSLAIGVARPTTVVRAAETKNIVILGTSDIHGNVDNYDYFSDIVPTGSQQRGLTKVWTYAKGVIASNPNTILIDNGDTIQGTPLSYYFNVVKTDVENPLALAMDTMGYVSATVGNHEFNYGPAVFNKYKADASFTLLSANVTGCQDYTFTPYVIKDVDGVQIGILGLTPPAVKYWERPENIVGCVFGDAVDAANNYVPIMKAAGADVIVVSAHSGLDATYGYGREENFITFLANEVPGIDVILAGHDHAKLASQLINGVLVTNPGNWTYNVSDIRITVTGSGSDWAVSSKSSTAQSMNTTPTTIEDPTLKALLQPYHDAAVTYINTPIGTATAAFPGGFPARIADGPTADLINQIQMEAADDAGFPVEASCAALFTNTAQLDAGAIKLKDAYRLYIYDNTLYVIEATGQMIKDEIEWTANYFNQYFYDPAGVTVNSAVRDYNYDLWSGIEYKIDVTKPVGQRVVELMLNGEPLAMDQLVDVALNNYRATGKFPQAKILYQSTTQVRDLIVEWIMARGTISPNDVFVQNFTLLPPVNTWLSSTTASPVSREDFANLLWTAFDQSADEYMKIPSDKGAAGADLNREGLFFLLSNKAMDSLRDVDVDMTALMPFTDAKTISSWAKGATAYAIQAGIFLPTGGKILPKQLVTNAEALAWVREARYPLYTFLSTNDFHGQLETGSKVSNKLVGGAAYNMTYINNYKALNPVGTMLMDAGDMMQGKTISNLLFGRSVIDVYNHMGYMASVTGNHEFDWGLDVLQERMEQAQFPILAANIFYAGTDTRPDWAVPTAMFTVKGQQIGVIGVTSKDTPSIVMAGNLAGLEFHDVGPIVNELAAQLRADGADVVVVLAHMPDVYKGVFGEMLTVAQPGVDLIISGHNHSGYSGKVNNIPIIQQYSSGTAIGVSDLRYDRVMRNILSSKLQVVTTWNEGITPDAGIAALVAEYQAEVAPYVNRPMATTLGLISRGPDRYTMEVPMGDLIADAQRWKGGTQIAFMNPGGIRADIGYDTYPHVITWGDFFTVQPFDNKLVTMNLTGAQIYAVLEQQFAPPQSSMKLLQESGLTYQFNLANPVGSRILNLTLTDGTPIANDSSTTYSVTMNEFIATGGDNFSAFLGGTNVTKIWVSDLDALIEYVQFKYGAPPTNTPIDPTVYPKIEGRITNVTP